MEKEIDVLTACRWSAIHTFIGVDGLYEAKACGKPMEGLTHTKLTFTIHWNHAILKPYIRRPEVIRNL